MIYFAKNFPQISSFNLQELFVIYYIIQVISLPLYSSGPISLYMPAPLNENPSNIDYMLEKPLFMSLCIPSVCLSPAVVSSLR